MVIERDSVLGAELGESASFMKPKRADADKLREGEVVVKERLAQDIEVEGRSVVGDDGLPGDPWGEFGPQSGEVGLACGKGRMDTVDLREVGAIPVPGRTHESAYLAHDPTSLEAHEAHLADARALVIGDFEIESGEGG